jgi:hypothetical protein
MAITAAEQTSIVRLVVGMFNAAPGATYLNTIASIFEANGHNLASLATTLSGTAAFQSMYSNGMTSQQFATAFLTTLNLQNNQTANDFIVAKANSGESRGDIILDAINALETVTSGTFLEARQILDNKTSVAIFFSVTQNNPDTNLADLQAVLNGVTSDANTVTNVEAALTAQAAIGTTFTLTTADETLTGGAKNDTFNAPGNAGTTLNAGDSITGGDGTDTFHMTSTATTNTALVGKVSGIEKIVLSGSDNIAAVPTTAQLTAITAAQAAVAAAQIAFNAAQAAINGDNLAIAAATADRTEAIVSASFAVVGNNNGQTKGNVQDLIDAATFNNGALNLAIDNALAAVTPPGTQAAYLAALQAAVAATATTFVTASTATLATDTAALTAAQTTLTAAQATLVTANLAANSHVDASFFVGSTDITADGIHTSVEKVTNQVVHFNSGTNTIANAISYAAANVAGTFDLIGTSGTVTLTGAALATESVTGSVASSGTLTLVDGTAGGTIKTLNLALSNAGTVDVSGLSARTKVDASGSTGALTLEFQGSLANSDTVIGGAGADTLNANLNKIIDYHPTISAVETLNVKFSVDGVLDGVNMTGVTKIIANAAAGVAIELDNLSGSVATVVTDGAGTTSGSVAGTMVNYASGVVGNLTYNLGSTAAQANISLGGLTTTNVGTLTINGLGKASSTTTDILTVGDIHPDTVLTSLTLTTSTKGNTLAVGDVESASGNHLGGLASLVVSGNGGNLSVDTVEAFSVNSLNTITTSALSTLTISAAGGSSTDVSFVDTVHDGDQHTVSGSTAITMSSTGAGSDANLDGGDFSNITSINLTAGDGSDGVFFGSGYYDSIGVTGSYTHDAVLDEWVYSGGGNVGDTTVTAGQNTEVQMGDLFADGSIGNVTVTSGAGSDVSNFWVAGNDTGDGINQHGTVGNITVSALDGSDSTSLFFASYDQANHFGTGSALAGVGNVSVTAGNAVTSTSVDVDSDGTVGNLSLTVGVASHTNEISAFAEGSIGTLTLNVGIDSHGEIDAFSNHGAVGATTATVGLDSSGVISVIGHSGTGAVTGTVALGGDLEVDAGTNNTTGAVGAITISGAGDAEVFVNGGDLIAKSIGTVDLSGITSSGFSTIDLSGVTLGTTIKVGAGGSEVTGTAGNDSITLGAGHDTVVVQQGSIVDAVTGFSTSADHLDLLSVTDLVNGTTSLGSGFTVTGGIATKAGATAADFIAAINADNNGTAGIVTFFDTASNSTFVAFTDAVALSTTDQIIKLVGVTAAFDAHTAVAV